MAEENDVTGEHLPRQPRRIKRDDPDAAKIEGDWPPPEQKAIVEAREAEQAEPSDALRGARKRAKRSE